MRKAIRAFLILGVVLSLSCSPSGDQNQKTADKAKQEPAFTPFPIYTNIGSRDNHYIPSGFMPDGQCLTFNDRWTENCHSGSTCMKIIYDVACSKQGARWAGIYWQNPAHNWGNRKGGFNLTGATRLTFWARGEKGGERIEEFKMGGVSGDYPDTDAAFIGPVILTPEWKEYSIDLRGKDLSYISGGFSWSTNTDVNPESCTFYLDDIRYE
jgi:hypothetical protein